MLSVKVLKKYLISPPPLTAHNTMHIHHKALGSFQYTAAGIVLAFSVHVRHILAETWTEFILQKYGLLGTIVEVVVVVQARNSISSQDQTYINERFFSDSKCSGKNNSNNFILLCLPKRQTEKNFSFIFFPSYHFSTGFIQSTTTAKQRFPHSCQNLYPQGCWVSKRWKHCLFFYRTNDRFLYPFLSSRDTWC